MSLTFEMYLIIALLLLYADIIIILNVILNRLRTDGRKEQLLHHEQEFVSIFSRKSPIEKFERFSKNYRQLKQSILLEDKEKEEFEDVCCISKVENKNINYLNSFFRLRRMEGAVRLGYIVSDRARIALEAAIKTEKDTSVKLYIANALSDIGDSKSIPILVSSLLNDHRWYRGRVNKLLISFGEDFNDYLPEIIDSEEAEIQELIVDFASVNFSAQLKDYLVKILEGGRITHSNSQSDSIAVFGNPMQLVYDAAETLATYYPNVMSKERYLNSDDVKIRNIAVKAISKADPFKSMEILITLLNDDAVANTSETCISEIINNNPELIQTIINKFEYEKDNLVRARFADILSHKIEYLIMRLVSNEKKSAREIITQVISLGKTSETIDFMNKNKNVDIENELLHIIKKILSERNPYLERQFCQYLEDRILEKAELIRFEEDVVENVKTRDKNVIRFVYSVMIFVFLLFPIIFTIRHYADMFSLSFVRQIGIYIVDFNYYIAFYSIAINLVYVTLIIFSVINVGRQSKLWKIKSNSLLFKEKMLPGISVIAPAHNEEKTIVESANSLLNLVYPDYDLIIVNDGSTDKTMEVLIKTFDLKRVDYKGDAKLKTKYIRGVYVNKSIPKLVVIDKLNGGKADSLNAGINQSRKEYFCGIDADSILEPDALLKLASRELDIGLEAPALGGNLYPANGCTIEKGSIVNKGLSENTLARFQTIEYVRAFMAGRLGWALSNCLLIISGAFGLFRKERVVDVGGYLTISGEYEKNTVGEDMELVVRIRRIMREKKLKYKIDYVYNANCWTEVPEDLKSLKTQRYRWHKGLIEILTFHRKMMFNPAYGRAGLVAMPYFFIFEFIGPFIEVQGYLMVLVAMILGLINVEIAMLLFLSIILMGTLVSLFSLLIAQKELEHFKGRDLGILILYAILENFGLRQMISIWRFIATLRLLWRQDGWGKAERIGF